MTTTPDTAPVFIRHELRNAGDQPLASYVSAYPVKFGHDLETGMAFILDDVPEDAAFVPGVTVAIDPEYRDGLTMAAVDMDGWVATTADVPEVNERPAPVTEAGSAEQ